MKNDQMQFCIDFIRFNQNSEGFDLEEQTEEVLRQILDDEISADNAVESYIEKEKLETIFKPLSDNSVFYPNKNVQVNYFNIKDKKKVKRIENNIYPLRLAEILKNERPTKFDFEFLKDLHSSLFGDIYPHSGEVRTFSASKRIVFCQPEFIDNMSKTLFKKLQTDRYLTHKDRRDFINDLAYYMGEMEALHPFTDGNGRATRIFFHLLSLNANYQIQWFEIDPDDLLEADICAIDGEYQLLVDVLNDAIPDD